MNTFLEMFPMFVCVWGLSLLLMSIFLFFDFGNILVIVKHQRGCLRKTDKVEFSILVLYIVAFSIILSMLFVFNLITWMHIGIIAGVCALYTCFIIHLFEKVSYIRHKGYDNSHNLNPHELL